MGQREVHDFLKKNPKEWFTSKKIAVGIGVNINAATTALKKMRMHSAVDFKTNGSTRGYIYKYKNE